MLLDRIDAILTGSLHKPCLPCSYSCARSRAHYTAVYKNSRSNLAAIESFGNSRVQFGVDATKLEESFPESKDDSHKFHRIQFNFPHWRGKANNRYNRYARVSVCVCACMFILDTLQCEVDLPLGNTIIERTCRPMERWNGGMVDTHSVGLFLSLFMNAGHFFLFIYISHRLCLVASLQIHIHIRTHAKTTLG